MATESRQQAYGGYVAERESHKESRVIAPSMTEAKAHKVSEKTAARDTGLLKIGSSPKASHEKKATSSKLFAQQQKNAALNKSAKKSEPAQNSLHRQENISSRNSRKM